MKLYIDDFRDPARFRPEENWIWAKTNTEAIRILETFPLDIDEIAIDHDIAHLHTQTELRELLGQEPGEDSPIGIMTACGETFEAVAHFLSLWARIYNRSNIPVTVHTSNPDGAQRLRRILEPLFIVTVNPGGVQKK